MHLTAHFVIVLTKCRIFLLIHFSDGAGRTGTYIAISNLLERMKIEHAMDVFQAIKIIRGIRPQFVENAVSIYSFPRPVNEMNCMRKWTIKKIKLFSSLGTVPVLLHCHNGVPGWLQWLRKFRVINKLCPIYRACPKRKWKLHVFQILTQTIIIYACIEYSIYKRWILTFWSVSWLIKPIDTTAWFQWSILGEPDFILNIHNIAIGSTRPVDQF